MFIKVIPDYSLSNSKLESLLTNIHVYKNLFERINFKDISLLEQNKIVFEILLSKNEIEFYYIIPDKLEDLVTNELNIAYPKSTIIKKGDNYSINKDENGIALISNDHMINIKDAIEFEYENHSFLSLQTNLKAEYPLSSFLETSKALREEDKVIIQYILIPCEQSTNTEFESCIKEFDKNKILARKHFIEPKEIVKGSLKLIYNCISEVMDIASLLIANEEYKCIDLDELDNNTLYRNGLSINTKEKASSLYYDTSIRVGVDSVRSDLLLKLFQRAFVQLKGDNNLKIRRLDKNTLMKAIVERKTIDKWGEDAFSTKELAQLMQLPTKYFQNVYKIKSIDTVEMDIPLELQGGKVRIGISEKRGKKIDVTWSNDKNIMSLAKVFIGAQNSGKTTAIKRSIKECHKAGYSNIVIDFIENSNTAREIAETINDNEKVVLELGNKDYIPAMAYNEITKLIREDVDPWERIQLSNLISEQIEYLINAITDNTTGELTSPMLRYLHAAAMITFIRPGAKINDVFIILRRWDKRNEAIRYAKYSKCFTEDDDIFYDLEELHERDKEGKIIGTREYLISGILNRIILLQKNPYLKAMLSADIDLKEDFANFIEDGKSIFIMIPQTKFPNPIIRDILTTFFISRVWLMAQMRENNKDARLCNIVFDEVHQVPTTAKFLSNHITEFRRHRLGLILSCHYLKQMKDLLTALKSSGASYLLLAGTEKENLESLKEEIQPYSVEDGLNLKPYTSLNVINYGNQYAKFIGGMPKI